MSQFVCSVAGCKPADQRGRIRHRLPKDEALRRTWLQCIGLPAKQKCALICGRHFKPEDYIHDPRIQDGLNIVMRHVLRPGTLPTLFVPNKADMADACSNVTKASQTGERCRCRRNELLSTAQAAREDCRRRTTSENGTQTLPIMQTTAIQTTKQSTSGRNAGTQADFDVRLQITTGMQTDSCDMPLLRARLKQYCDPPALAWECGAQAITPVQRASFLEAEEMKCNDVGLVDTSYRLPSE
ncbi:hypothetical protein HPB51_001266 [Rhipicephalus microplus]|uniref:THAP-type domain-containing protein n=1 Tax=Rhipicephalus microplus TaxID=6941 RepID=A0A9J6E655_RHIMP|nr:hypothetical protein HPB51_001266 [Rhipicephalus microplus]